MSNTEQVQKALKEHSDANIDEYIHANSFNDKLQDVSLPSFELRLTGNPPLTLLVYPCPHQSRVEELVLLPQAQRRLRALQCSFTRLCHVRLHCSTLQA